MRAALLALLLAALAAPAEPPDRDRLGRELKLRILVDKVMQATTEWVTEPWMIEEAAAGGFNVYSPRRGHEDLDAVRRVTAWCSAAGVWHLPWMRGTLIAPAGPAADGQRLVWADGTEQELYSPCADAFWEWTEQYIVEYARISAEMPGLLGVFLDYENYSPNKRGNCYELSYDDGILGRFAAEQGVDLPRLALDRRRDWLVGQGLHDEFEAYQIADWRRRCRELRRKVDEHNPNFWFVIYPAPGTKFMVDACWPEWQTAAAPLVLADPWVYGRPARYQGEQEALAGNRAILERGLAQARAAGINFLYSGGIDPLVTGADPEFSAKNALLISELTAGYWVFYEGPTYQQGHADYFHWFSWANDHLDAGNFAAQREPRQTPEGWELDALRGAAAGARLTAADTGGRTERFADARLRGDSVAFIAATAGRRVELVMRHHRLGNYRTQLAWSVRDPAGRVIAGDRIDYEQEGTIAFTPQTTGLYVLIASAGQCGYSFRSANAPVGLLARDRLGLLGAVPRLWFRVPEGLEEFTLTCRASAAETIKATVFDPDGREVVVDETDAERTQLDLRVTNARPGVWSIALTRAATGAIEDHSLQLDERLIPAVSLSPEQVFEFR